MQSKVKLSRRNFLLGIGVLGSGAAIGACGGLFAANTLLRNQAQADSPNPTAIPRFQQPSIISRSDWGALPPNHNAWGERGFYPDNWGGWRIYEDDLAAAYQTVVIHHSAFYEEDDLATMLEVQDMHRNRRNWADVAYHFLVGKNGLIYEGRDWHVRGTHVAQYNSGSLGICLLGNFVQESPSEAQLASTLALVNWASERLQLTHIASHRQFNPQTQCPGDNLVPYLEQFAAPTGLTIGTDGYISPNASASCPCCDCTKSSYSA